MSNANEWRKTKKETGLIDLDKLDMFIELALSKYEYNSPEQYMYKAAGKHSYFIINNNSLTPDLVFFNETFNKNLCFHDFKGSSFNPFPRKKFKFESRKAEQEAAAKEGNSFGSINEDDDPQWADVNVEELAEHQFQKLPDDPNKSEIMDILDFRTKEDELQEDDFIESINRQRKEMELLNDKENKEDEQAEEKNTDIENKENKDVDASYDDPAQSITNTFNINIFYNNYKDLEQNEPTNNDFDINFLQQMSQKVYGMRYSNENSIDHSKDESMKEKTGLKSLLDEADRDESMDNSMLKNIEMNILESVDDKSKPEIKPEKEEAVNLNHSINSSSNTSAINSTNPNKQNQKGFPNQFNMQMPYGMMGMPMNPYFRPGPGVNPFGISNNSTNSKEGQNKKNEGQDQDNSKPFQQQQMFPMFPHLMYQMMQNNMMKNMYNNQNKNTTSNNNSSKAVPFEMSIEDPITIIYKNLLEKGWFLQVDNKKMINMNSIELLDFLEAYFKAGKKADKLSVTDYQSDMYFSPNTLLENLKEVIPQIKMSMPFPMTPNIMNAGTSTWKNNDKKASSTSLKEVVVKKVSVSSTGNQKDKVNNTVGVPQQQGNNSNNNNTKTMNLNVNLNFQTNNYNVNNIIIEEDKRKRNKKIKPSGYFKK